MCRGANSRTVPPHSSHTLFKYSFSFSFAIFTFKRVLNLNIKHPRSLVVRRLSKFIDLIFLNASCCVECEQIQRRAASRGVQLRRKCRSNISSRDGSSCQRAVHDTSAAVSSRRHRRFVTIPAFRGLNFASKSGDRSELA